LKVVALYRVSSEKQANEGASLDAQQRRYRELAAARGWETVAEFRGAESASKDRRERKMLRRVLDTFDAELVDALWVYEQSRLSRGDGLEVEMLLRDLRERGISLYIGDERLDLDDPSARLTFGIYGTVARYEVERFQERVQRGRGEKALQGKRVVGRSPYGYRNPPTGDPRHGFLQVVPETAAVVRRIFALAAEGIGRGSIARILTRDGVQRPDGENGPWGQTSVGFILRNPVYLGHAVGRGWQVSKVDGIRRFDPTNPRAIVVENAYEPIIDADLWERAHARDTRTGGRPSWLTGLLWIEGKRVVIGRRRGGHSIYRPAQGCGPGVSAEEMGALVWAGFVAHLRQPRAILELLRHSGDPAALESIEGEVATADRIAAKLRTRRDGLVRALADGDIDRTEFKRQRDATEAELRAAEERASSLRRRLEIARNGSREREVLAVARLVAAGKLNEAARRKALLAIVERIDATVADRGIQTKGDGGRYAKAIAPRWGIADIFLRLRGIEPATSSRRCDQSCVTVQIVAAGRVIEPENGQPSRVEAAS